MKTTIYFDDPEEEKRVPQSNVPSSDEEMIGSQGGPVNSGGMPEFQHFPVSNGQMYYCPIGPVTDSLYYTNPALWFDIHLNEELKDKEAYRKAWLHNMNAQVDLQKEREKTEILAKRTEELEKIRTNAKIDRDAMTVSISIREGYIIAKHDKINTSPVEASVIRCPIERIVLLKKKDTPEAVLCVIWRLLSGRSIKMLLHQSDWSGRKFYKALLKIGLPLAISRNMKTIMAGVLSHLLEGCDHVEVFPDHYGWEKAAEGYRYIKKGKLIWRDILSRCC